MSANMKPSNALLDYYGKDLIVPAPWRYSEAPERRAAVIDPNFTPPRIVRYVGWRKCIGCGEMFFSEHLKRNRFCACRDFRFRSTAVEAFD